MDPLESTAVRGHRVLEGTCASRLGPELCADLGDPAREPAKFLERVFALEPRRWLRRIPGRETFAHGEAIVVKRFLGNPWSERWHEWTRGRRARSPARREGENLAALRELGLCVPAPLAWSEERAGSASARSALAMELLAHEEHLRQRLARAEAGEVHAWLAPLAGIVAKLHREHWFHRDLYLQHFAVLSAERRSLALLDCGRARREDPVPMRWRVKDLAQLLHSAPDGIAARAKLRWLVLYAREEGSPSALDLRSLARAVAQKERRMRAHRPRHLDPRTAHPDGTER